VKKLAVKKKAKKAFKKGKKTVAKTLKTVMKSETAKEILKREKLLAADLLIKAAERLRKEAKKK
jgi:hypothetical protein